MKYREQRNIERVYERQSAAIHKLFEGELTPTREQYLKGLKNEKKRFRGSILIHDVNNNNHTACH